MKQTKVIIEITITAIKKASGSDKVEAWVLELSDFASVTAFADRFDKDGGKLDYLIVNAAVALYDYTETKDGWESQYVSFLPSNCIS